MLCAWSPFLDGNGSLVLTFSKNGWYFVIEEIGASDIYNSTEMEIKALTSI